MSSRIEHGVNGHLIDISTAPESLVEALHDVQSLHVVRENIRRQEIVRIEDMLNEYYCILDLDRRDCVPGKSVRRAVSKEHSSSSHKLKQLVFRSHIRIQDSIVSLDFSQKTRWQILSTYRGLVYFPRIIIKKILK
jgi:hypothetical protein